MNLGVIGVGNMGLAMALHLRDCGHAVSVRDVVSEREALAEGAQVAPSPQQMARTCRVIIVAVVDAAQTAQVLFGHDGLSRTMQPGGTVVLCPTIAPADVEHFAQRLGRAGIDCIDAPMSGGPARARDGSMSLMVACDDALFARHEGLLRILASRLFRVGAKPGDGARTKLVNNLLAAVNLAAAAEAMALARRVGLDTQQTLAVIEQSSGQSWIGSDRMRRALAGDFAPRARMSLLAKDSALALAMAEAAGIAPELGRAAAALFAQACAEGCSALDDASLLSVVEQHSPPAHPAPTRPRTAGTAP